MAVPEQELQTAVPTRSGQAKLVRARGRWEYVGAKREWGSPG